MARHNTSSMRNRAGVSAVRSTGVAARTAQGGAGVLRDARSELFLAAVTSLNEDSFYESAQDRDARIRALLEQENIYADTEWLSGLIRWLRREANLRAVPVMVAAAAVRVRLDNGVTGHNRDLIRASIGRLDEASELLAYWMSTYGRRIPSAVKRGVADAVRVMLDENSYLKYRGRMASGAVSLRDVLNLVHPTPQDAKQARLFGLVLDEAYGNETDTASLPVIAARARFLALSREDAIKELSDAETARQWIRDARLTHEVIAGAIGTIPAEVWANLVDSMGYTALRMNLRRMKDSGISDEVIDRINDRLKDKEELARSRTMPLSFLSAYRNAPLDFASALQRAANGVLENVPSLSGRTLIMVDKSGSMCWPMSARSVLKRADAAGIFGAALALRAEDADLFTYDTEATKVELGTRDLLRITESMVESGGGTATARIAGELMSRKRYDRVIILTDEQDGGGWWDTDKVSDVVPKDIPLFIWNLDGYQVGSTDSGPNRYTFGGLTDKGMEMIPLLERGLDAGWPWEK